MYQNAPLASANIHRNAPIYKVYMDISIIFEAKYIVGRGISCQKLKIILSSHFKFDRFCWRVVVKKGLVMS